MTLAGATFSDRFATAIAQFGFIDNRQMSLITGDYTCERERLSPNPRTLQRLTTIANQSDACCHCLIDVLMSCSSDEEEYFTSAEAMGRSDIVGKIDRIACPMLLMHGMCECSPNPTAELLLQAWVSRARSDCAKRCVLCASDLLLTCL